MNAGCKETFEELYQTSQDIQNLLLKINTNLNQNDPELVEQVQRLIESRGEIINRLENCLDGKPFPPEDSLQNQVSQLQEWEVFIQEKLGKLNQAFSKQIQKFQQSRQLTNHYQEGYGTIYTDGAFIDRRK